MNIYNSNCDFNKYKMFYAVAENKSFSKAAEILHISQPAISYAIKELEKQLDTTLLIRENKSIKLTDEGSKLIFYIEKIFSNVLMAERTLKEDSSKLSGEVRIGIYSHISLFLLPKIMKKFSELYPNVKFNVYSSSNKELKEKLKKKELDFIILHFPVFIDNNNFVEELLFELDTCIYGLKKYYDLYKKDSNTISEYPLILPMRGFNDIDNLEKKLKLKNIYIKNNYRIYTSELTKSLVSEGVGIGFGLKKSIEKELENNIFYEIPVDIKLPTAKFSVAYDINYLNTTSTKFLKFFIEEVKKEYPLKVD